MASRTSPPQSCSEPGCDRAAAFRTRTRATWCDHHITEILRRGGLAPLEPFAGPTAWRRTRCLECGCEAHYRLVYILEKNAIDERTCRACYWRQWAARGRSLQGVYADLTPTSQAEARAHADSHGYDYLGPLTNPSLPNDPHHVKCRYCERLSADRLGDIGFGCSCQTNPRRTAAPPSGAAAKPKRKLLKDSDLDAADWWDHGSNDESLWATVTEKARRDVAWRCPDCQFTFTAPVYEMSSWPSCPRCKAKRDSEWAATLEEYASKAVVDVPELAAAWADEADPRLIPVAGGWELRRFVCPRGHHPRLQPLTYLQSGCPHCRGQRTTDELLASLTDFDVAPPAMHPEIAAQWHPTRNAARQLATVSPTSRKLAWWLDQTCGHEWEETPRRRDMGQRLKCPECRTILDSLAFHFPDLAAEWSPDNPVTAWQVRPTGTTSFIPTWVCATDSAHVWQASLASRSAGSGCPQCREHGKSQVELDHYAAAVSIFGKAASGTSVRDDAFTHRPNWLVDITAELPDGRPAAIEYDGSYWHAGKADVDLAKSLDLLAAGFLVARLREHPLPPLAVDNPSYMEVVVYAEAPDPVGTVDRVRRWGIERSTRSAE